jgi:hypothetical protein
VFPFELISANSVRGIVLENIYTALFVANPVSNNFFYKPIPERVSRV